MVTLPTVIETPRLTCKPLHREPPSNLRSLFEDMNEETFQFISFDRPTTPEETSSFIDLAAEKWDSNDAALYVAYDDSDTPIGYVGFWNIELTKKRTEVGGVIASSYQGQGYFSEWFDEALRVAFEELALDAVLGVTSAQNRAAVKVCEELFPEQEPTRIPNEVLTSDGPTDGLQFVYWREQWEERRH